MLSTKLSGRGVRLADPNFNGEIDKLKAKEEKE
jgi:hypothetical protein